MRPIATNGVVVCVSVCLVTFVSPSKTADIVYICVYVYVYTFVYHLAIDRYILIDATCKRPKGHLLL